ncbi:MAG: folylpolyglutamate synthase/dihydrofolate synthase, partial [Erysipelotrichaceae bacterium]|nr:folylpolyglutamate synthase/dihydrofolate synthase [Erysipelotrichaceae bacterium]
MNVQEKIKQMETKRNHNHPLLEYRQWLTEAMPQHTRLQKIQIAGTNGKGSTARWLSDLLMANGWKVGMFTSPHLIEHTERIRVNRQPIPLEDWERIYDTYADFFEEMELTMFEMDCWMAIAYFLEQGVDIALMEVGLGGRLDATTALDYQCTLITNIGMDHMEVLGDSPEQIAFEKAGIFKPGVIALTTEKDPACQKVMELVAGYIQAPLGFVEMPTTEKDGVITFVWNDQTFTLTQPAYQMDNLALALECTQVLGIDIDGRTVQPVIDSFSVPGRFTVLRQQPLILVDGAHNPDGIRALVNSVPGFAGDVYFCAMKEKEVEEMLACLQPLHAKIHWVQMNNERACAPVGGLPVIAQEDLAETLKQSDRDSLVCGSIYLVGDLMAA